MKFLLLFLLMINLQVTAGGTDGGGGPAIDNVRLAPGSRLMNLNNGFTHEASIRENLIKGISLNNGEFLDRYDLKYTEAGKNANITLRKDRVYVPINRYSAWKHIELKNGAVIQNKKSRLPIIIDNEGYRSLEDRVRRSVKLPRQVNIQLTR